VKERMCQTVSRERLVAYADGDLSPSEAEPIAEHIATCPHCQAVIEALARSLQVTQAIWQTGQARWPEAHSFDRVKSNRWELKKVAAVAASILLILGVGAIWRLLSEPSERTRVISEEAKVVELRLRIADSSDAARLLAAVELLSKYPEAESGVKQRYLHIVETYPETAAAEKAKLKIQ
jgi:predicted anti-sigma-YlaC factor YlaD